MSTMHDVSDHDVAGDILDTAQVADLLGIRPASVRQARWRGRMAEPDIVLSGRPGWRRQTIDAWRAEHEHEP
jgi:hypothetical protein